MNAELELARQHLDQHSRHYATEMRRAVHGLQSSLQLGGHAFGAARRIAPALPYLLAAAAAGVVILQLRRSNAPRLLMIGGLVFDGLRVLALATQRRQPAATALAPPLPPAG